ncbi:MAG: alanine--tRNA ligase [Candidatus Latescibacteria bacterium]|nr:alanine--tRNA ligase [Candidatus Latescibacterota bacterium]
MTGSEIRRAFLDFFVEREHAEVSSSPVVPAEDPTLLFTNAGMNQFKKVFTGEESRSYLRAATVQKCIRVSGKHNDLENVGLTPRHHTFFEMMGNFSFGDYFKEEAVLYAWDFLTGTVGLPKDRLYATIYTDDDEAGEAWKRVTDIDPARIYRLGKEENYWSMGETGPQGPCSEVLYDIAPSPGEDPTLLDPTDSDRFLEVWNLVFMQFEAQPSGELIELPRPSIDTGLGLERLASILQGVDSNFDTDLVRPLIDHVCELVDSEYDPGEKGVSHRVIADHVRALTFAITDGVIPSNEGRGYVLRRLLRRAARHGRKLDMKEPFIYKLVPTVVSIFKEAYPEVAGAEERTMLVVRTEEERFGETLDQGIERFEELVAAVKEEGEVAIPGHEAFVLYDTYGFPLDLTQVMAEERGFPVDVEGFNAALQEQKERSRADRAEKGAAAREEAFAAADSIPSGEEGRTFVGYDLDRWVTEGRIIALFDAGFGPVDRLGQGERGFAVLSETPFYAEAGGQASDRGEIEGDGFIFGVDRVDSFGSVIFHGGITMAGVAAPGPVQSRLDAVRRGRIMRNHTATHLVHAALRDVLGVHVQQSGSLVEQDRLRFDFSHFSSVTPGEQAEVIRWVNRGIRANIPVLAREMPYQEALNAGALAFFGEKYGDLVRVVEIPGWTMELCGGTHVERTGDISFFRILHEGSISSGVRRVEAATAQDAVETAIEDRLKLHSLEEMLGTTEVELIRRVQMLVNENRNLRKESAHAAALRGMDQVEEIIGGALEVAGVSVVTGRVEVPEIAMLRTLADTVRSKLGSGVGVLGMEQEGKAVLLCVVTDDLVEAGWKAGTIIKDVAAVAGGKGGGKPHMAQAGGPDAGKLDEALSAVPDIVRSHAPGH